MIIDIEGQKTTEQRFNLLITNLERFKRREKELIDDYGDAKFNVDRVASLKFVQENIESLTNKINKFDAIVTSN